MATYKGAVVMVLTELVDSDDGKPRRGKTREWIKRRRESGYFQNIFQELKVEYRMGFKDKFCISVTEYELLLSQISDLISPNERISRSRSILADERLALTLRYFLQVNLFSPLVTNVQFLWWQYFKSQRDVVVPSMSQDIFTEFGAENR